MKPREFDDLIKQKFDENDFEYNPRNWERLEDQLEGRSKKRSIIMWWWMPLVGVAASVAALAIGINFMWRQAATGDAGVSGFACNIPCQHSQPLQIQESAPLAINNVVPKNHKNKKAGTVHSSDNKEEIFNINLQNALSFNQAKKENKFNLLAAPDDLPKTKGNKKEVTAGYNTFKPEETNKAPKMTILLSGGINQGAQSSGYAGGGTIRKMINDKVYIESDLAFVSSSAIQSTTYQTNPSTVTTNVTPSTSGPMSKSTNGGNSGTVETIIIPGSTSTNSNTYTMSYIQVTPSVGVKILKKLSIAGGPDIQQALADTRPSASGLLTRDNLAVMPLFDMGLIGKTEYSITKKIKAQLSYRKGINNALTPDKYIDRDYMQMQIRCAIFNK